MGRLAILAGCESYSGASVIAELGASAFALGDGLVKLCVPDCILYPVMSKITECTLLSMPSKNGGLAFSEDYLEKAIRGANAVLYGNGVDVTEDTARILSYLIEKVEVPLVLDADALNALSYSPDLLRKRSAPTVLTPHPKEFSRLMNTSNIIRAVFSTNSMCFLWDLYLFAIWRAADIRYLSGANGALRPSCV